MTCEISYKYKCNELKNQRESGFTLLCSDDFPEVKELPLVCQVDLDLQPDSPNESLLAEEAFVIEDNDIFSRPLASRAATVATF